MPDLSISLPKGKFEAIAADPNWRFDTYDGKITSRSVENHYETALIEQISALPVRDVAARDCHLFLWITGSQLARGAHLPIMKAWGFRPSSVAFVWVKINNNALQGQFMRPATPTDFFMSLGHTTRQNCEFVMLGRRGNARRIAKDVRQVIIEPRRQHSRKPEQFYASVERYVGQGARKLELHARQERAGWTAWGDEITKFNEVAA